MSEVSMQAVTEVRAEAEQKAFDSYGKIIGITTDIFGEDVRIKESYDPEFPAEKYIVLVVEATGGNDVLLRMESEWIRRVAQVTLSWHGIRLSIKRKK
jgi:hypothetical protein